MFTANMHLGKWNIHSFGVCSAQTNHDKIMIQLGIVKYNSFLCSVEIDDQRDRPTKPTKPIFTPFWCVTNPLYDAIYITWILDCG